MMEKIAVHYLTSGEGNEMVFVMVFFSLTVLERHDHLLALGDQQHVEYVLVVPEVEVGGDLALLVNVKALPLLQALHNAVNVGLQLFSFCTRVMFMRKIRAINYFCHKKECLDLLKNEQFSLGFVD